METRPPEPERDPRAYVRLAAGLRQQITDEPIASGQPVPSITVLAARHHYSRQTCRKALQLLAAEGLLRRIPGLGYHVI